MIPIFLILWMPNEPMPSQDATARKIVQPPHLSMKSPEMWERVERREYSVVDGLITPPAKLIKFRYCGDEFLREPYRTEQSEEQLAEFNANQKPLRPFDANVVYRETWLSHEIFWGPKIKFGWDVPHESLDGYFYR